MTSRGCISLKTTHSPLSSKTTFCPTPQHTCLAPFYLAHELSLLLGPVQNKNMHSRGPKYAGRLGQSRGKSEKKECLKITLFFINSKEKLCLPQIMFIYFL